MLLSNAMRNVRLLPLGAVPFAIASVPALATAQESPARTNSSDTGHPQWSSPASPSEGVPAASASRFDYDPAKPVPPGYHVETSLSPLFGVGVVMFGLPYGLSVWAGAKPLVSPSSSSACPADRWLVVPIGGPFIAADGRGRVVHFSSDSLANARQFACEDADGVGRAVLAFDGLLQIVGAGLVLAGLGQTRAVLVQDGLPKPVDPAVHLSERVRWRVVPWHSGTSIAGVDVVATF
jgi:hypothetical protein